ncbi:MAG: TIGR03862 family flavoprotein [Pseudomonadota bacterium]
MAEIPTDVLVIGGGPAGLAAAEVASDAGRRVVIADRMPSLGRKFLMAGKSGLNLTQATHLAGLIRAISPPASQIEASLAAFDAPAVTTWAEGLGQSMFTGSSGRVFPRAMKASPLLRAWLARLDAAGVDTRRGWRWTGALSPAAFETPEGPRTLPARAIILALGGASWARLGSDGSWTAHLPSTPLRPANVGFERPWSAHMSRHFGAPVKSVRLKVGDVEARGEFVITARGVEGGAIYTLSRALREGGALTLDLFPDRSAEDLEARLARPGGKASRATRLRKALGLTGVRAALVRELLGARLPTAADLKSLPLALTGPCPLDSAISTAGGVPLSRLNADLMLQPGVFVAGEMLDWEAPTGGYLLTTCLATGRHAGRGAHRWLLASEGRTGTHAAGRDR